MRAIWLLALTLAACDAETPAASRAEEAGPAYPYARAEVDGYAAPLPAPSPATALAAAPPLAFSRRDARCGGPARFEAAAQANAASLTTLAWAPFGREEAGWEIYAPKLAVELKTPCAPDTPGFASALATWQNSRRAPADGVFKPADGKAIINGWHRERPFVAYTSRGLCPDPPADFELATATAADGYSGKIVRLKPGALQALRRMVAAARAEVPEIARDKQMLTVFSGYRSPQETAAACAARGGCFKPVSSGRCSAHRTGLAVDLTMGAAPGSRVDSSEDFNRLYMSRTPAYRWMIVNARRFGFVNYPFEPWHWEWTGEVLPAGRPMSPTPGPPNSPQSPAGSRP